MSQTVFKRIAVKIGSNVLTRADGTLDVTRMSAIVDQAAELHRRGVEIILISSGAVASGRGELKLNKLPDAVSQRQLFSAVGQTKLINRYYELFRDHQITCGQVLTTKENFASRRHYLNQKNCMTVMLEAGVIPIVNENDTISVTELMFTDNDELSGLIATMMSAEALIILSNVNGIYDGDPQNPDSKIIAEITDKMDLQTLVQSEKSSFGRGGMQTKYNIARKVADEGITVIIANGKQDNILMNLLYHPENQLHTRFIPNEKPVSNVKKWIAHSDSFAKGEVHINTGAREALQGNHASSLLPVGITVVKGEFEKDDIVKIIDENGLGIGWGKTAFDSGKVLEIMGKKGNKPVVHYDYLYLD
ncbi:MAG: glutamate 5-kinase [Candidatus Symbiothrix sp.]|jgi:glutamate 5-kinase|nr:glutamate 5-kinase [Candidatus Symbiothrix sp.]